MEADLRDLISDRPGPAPASAARDVFGEGTSTWAIYRDAPGSQALPPGLPARAARALPDGRPGRRRDLGHLPRGRPRHRRHRGAAPRHRQARGLRGSGRRDLDVGPRAPARGDPLGYYRVRRAIERLDGFPPDLEQALLHIILSHHGSLEHGSPVVPCTREATLVHMIDNLGGRSAASTESRRSSPPARSGRCSTRGSAPAPTSPRAAGASRARGRVARVARACRRLGYVRHVTLRSKSAQIAHPAPSAAPMRCAPQLQLRGRWLRTPKS